MKYYIYKPIALKLYQVTLCKLFNFDWTGLNFYYYLKPHVRSGNLLNCKTKESCILSILAKFVYLEFFYDSQNDFYRDFYPDVVLESGDIESLKGEELLWQLEYIYEMIKYHSAIKTNEFNKLEIEINTLYKLYEEDEL